MEVEVADTIPFPAMLMAAGMQQIPGSPGLGDKLVAKLPKPMTRAPTKTVEQQVSAMCLTESNLLVAQLEMAQIQKRLEFAQNSVPVWAAGVTQAQKESVECQKQVGILEKKKGTPAEAKASLKKAITNHVEACEAKVKANTAKSERAAATVAATHTAMEEEIKKIQGAMAALMAGHQVNVALFEERAVAEAVRNKEVLDLLKARMETDYGVQAVAQTTCLPPAEEGEVTVLDPHRSKKIDFVTADFPVIKEIGEEQRSFLHQLETTIDFFQDVQTATCVVPEVTYGTFFGDQGPDFTVECINTLRKLLGETIWVRMYGDYPATATDALPIAFALKAIPRCLVRLATLLEPADEKDKEEKKKRKDVTLAKLSEAAKKKKTTGCVKKSTIKA